ncbi:CpaF family protein (plasmid) [Clostridium perfringens]
MSNRYNSDDEPLSLLGVERMQEKKIEKNRDSLRLQEKRKVIKDIREYIVKTIGVQDYLFSEDQEQLNSLRMHIMNYLKSYDKVMTSDDIKNFTELMVVDIKGLGPLEQFRLDDSVKEIKCNTYKQIYIYKTTGEKVLTNVKFDSEEDFIHVIAKIADYNNKSFGYNSPRLSGVLPNRMRVHAIHNSLSDNGTRMNIRKFPKRLTLGDLVNFGACSPEVAWLLTLIPATRKTFGACGPTGSGKTTLGMALFDYAPRDLAIVSIEDTRELDLLQEDWSPLVTREANSEGEGAVTISDLFSDCMRITPDCIIVGEVRKPKDAYEMLQAFHTGHKGSFITIHASSTENFATRLATLLLDSGRDISMYSAKEMIAGAFDYIIFQERETINVRTQKQKQFIKGLAEIQGFDYKTGEIILKDILKWKSYGIDFLGNKKGRLEATGEMPVKLFAAAKEYGIDFNEQKFRDVFINNVKPME